jgi:hypothetical protein
MRYAVHITSYSIAFIYSSMTIGSGIQVILKIITSKISDASIFELLIGGIYEICR